MVEFVVKGPWTQRVNVALVTMEGRRRGSRTLPGQEIYVDGAAELVEVQGLELAVCGSSIRSGIANFSNLCCFWNHMQDRWWRTAQDIQQNTIAVATSSRWEQQGGWRRAEVQRGYQGQAYALLQNVCQKEFSVMFPVRLDMMIKCALRFS